MWKPERRLLEWIEKHMLLLALLFVSLLALYLRKIAVWWSYEKIAAYFDMHGKYTQTAAWYLLERILEYPAAAFSVTPAHLMKWLSGLADFGLAGMSALLLGRNAHPVKRLILFVVTLFSPVIFLRGVIWAQPESLAAALLLLALWLYEERAGMLRPVAFFVVILAISLCPYFFPMVLVYLWKGKRTEKLRWGSGLVILAGGVLLQIAGAVCIGAAVSEGLETCLRWMSYHPETGELYESGLEWLLGMLCLYGLPLTVYTELSACRREKGYVTAALAQIALTVLYGSILF